MRSREVRILHSRMPKRSASDAGEGSAPADDVTYFQQFLDACIAGDLTVLSAGLEQDPRLAQAVHPEHKWTALHAATRPGHLDVVQTLLMARADVLTCNARIRFCPCSTHCLTSAASLGDRSTPARLRARQHCTSPRATLWEGKGMSPSCSSQLAAQSRRETPVATPRCCVRASGEAIRLLRRCSRPRRTRMQLTRAGKAAQTELRRAATRVSPRCS